MANDKDFIVKNAVEVGGPTNVTLGTITSGTVDLSTGNYFSETLAANTTYAFSNAGDVQSFQLEVTGGAVVEYYDLTNASYDSISVSVSTQDASMGGLFFKTDGTKMFTTGFAGDKVYEYGLSTAWDITTASFTQDFSVATEETGPVGLAFKPDGTEMYVVGQTGDDVNQYTLSTAWDISTASYTRVFSIAAQETTPEDVRFKPDGTKMYVCGSTTNAKISEYTLSTAWDISTASYTTTVNLSAQGTNPKGFDFSADGTRLVTVVDAGDTMYQYTLSTAWNISTATYDNISLSVSGENGTPVSLAFKSDGSKVYMLGTTTPDSVYQYSTTTSTTTTLTWPTSIEWAGGGAPAAPATGETDLFTFSTDDGGTSYIGLKTADNLS